MNEAVPHSTGGGERRPMSEMERLELRVFYVLCFAFLVFSFVGLVGMRMLSENRRRVMVPLFSYLCFFSIDSIYRQWTELQTIYGNRPLELAFFRIALMGVIAKLVDMKIGNNAAVPQAASAEAGGKNGIHVNTIAHWFIWFPVIGVCLAAEELMVSFPESFIAFIVSLILLTYKQRTQAKSSKLFWISSLLVISGVLMAKSGSMTWKSVLAGFARTLWLFGVDFVMSNHGPISPFKLIYGPATFATALAFLAFVFFEFTHPRYRLDETQRGLLDFLSAAVLGSMISVLSMVSMIEICMSSSLASLQVVTVLVETLVFCILMPLSGLPLHFHVILGLNITGFVLVVLFAMLALRSDPFLSNVGPSNSVIGMLSSSSAAVFKFLDEESAQAEKEEQGPTIKEIGEDEWLLTFAQTVSNKDKSNAPVKKGLAESV